MVARLLDMEEVTGSSPVETTIGRMVRFQNFVREKYRDETLVNKKETKRMDERPKIICSMGLRKKHINEIGKNSENNKKCYE